MLNSKKYSVDREPCKISIFSNFDRLNKIKMETHNIYNQELLVKVEKTLII